jgi:hypothetical protein
MIAMDALELHIFAQTHQCNSLDAQYFSNYIRIKTYPKTWPNPLLARSILDLNFFTSTSGQSAYSTRRSARVGLSYLCLKPSNSPMAHPNGPHAPS